VHRYFDGATWPFLTGVACSLVPVASLHPGGSPRIESLGDLRTWLTSRGVPCRDVAVDGPAFDLRSEGELLRLTERVVASVDETLLADHDGRVHPTARLVGPVVIQPGAVVAAGATVIGPAVVGAEALISAGAVVAQCLITDGVTIPPSAVVRGRAVFTDRGAPAAPALPDTLDDSPATPTTDVEPPTPRAIYPAAKLVAEAFVAAAALCCWRRSWR
jgi:carbonic anhydrase/acetyltransferase-like protein (isoleucine patch superfamily)